MNSNSSRSAKPKMGRHTKKTTHLPRMWKNSFHKFEKFHQKILQLYTCNLRKNTRIRIHYIHALSKKGRNNQTRKWNKIKSTNHILS